MAPNKISYNCSYKAVVWFCGVKDVDPLKTETGVSPKCNGPQYFDAYLAYSFHMHNVNNILLLHFHIWGF